ncbi:hybrid sensor histidine kinase/response regulator [Halorussus salinisoli]|uniref:hybrid sensor histidine kinase/response regulator n=1 Tax=Halorussus salinisoli TaxID=2558242 RepID=UPI0010C1F23C|nr:response regulator [Halorussus salinisoli]
MAAIRVLLVDDRPPVADLTATYLERVDDDISAHIETSAEAGLERLDAESFDCVVSDYEMPEQDGLEFLADVRDLAPDLPFVLFTGKGSEEIASEAISAGVTDYLQKGSGNEQYEVLANRIENAVAQYRAQQEAREANEQVRRLHSRITDAFYALDDDWQMTYVNEQAADFLERDPDELVGEDIREAFPEAVGDEFYEAYTEALETKEPVTLVAESVFQPGRWVEERVFPSEDGLSIYFRDITERRRHEHTLNALHDATRELMHAETEREIASIVCRTADTVLEFPGTGMRLYDPEQNALVNVAIGGENADEIDGRPKFGVEDSPHGRAYREGETVTVEVDEATTDDLGPFSRTMYVPVGEYGILSVGKHEDEPFTESSVQFVEILTENARAAFDRADRETRLRERERGLEAQNERLEEFASVVSHDLRNPLNVARGHFELARETGREESFDRVAAAHDRMGSLIDDLLVLARKGQTVGRTEPVALAEVAEGAWANVATGGAALEVEAPETVEADPDRLCNLFENLFRNSVDHAGDDPTVRVVGRNGGFAVADDGPGIPEGQRDRLFECGHSTDDGTGLGLSIVEGIADAHGWEVEVGESEAGGVEFVFEVEG